MTYKDGSWGDKIGQRSLNRREYFRMYQNKRYHSMKRNHVVRKKYSNGSSMGYMAEKEAMDILKGSRRIYQPTDLSWEGKFVEVKSAIKHHGDYIQWTTKERKKSTTYRWKFYLKQLGIADLFIIICKNENKKTEHIFLIPSSIIKVKHLTISENKLEKYEKYRLSL